jgi:endonuclease YncB( thermonuclease family)
MHLPRVGWVLLREDEARAVLCNRVGGTVGWVPAVAPVRQRQPLRQLARRAVLLVALSLLTALLALGGNASAQQPNALLGYVTRVADGDTISVAIGNQIEKVRYIGINTPEIHHPTKGTEPYGAVAREANARLVEGRWVNLILDVQQRDSLGRLLAYVYIGNRFINAELVWQGYAEAATYPPNVRYADYFVGLQRQARESRRGLWADPDAVSYYRPRPPDYAGQPQPPTAGASPQGATGSAVGPAPASALPSGSFRGSSPSAAPASPGTDVNVRGYTRGDGSYGAPYTRSAPKK